MKNSIVGLCFLVALALPSPAQAPEGTPAPSSTPLPHKAKQTDYRYYKVSDKDTIETICLMNNCDGKTLLELNPQLKLRQPQELGVVFVPAPPPRVPRPKKVKAAPVQVEEGGKIEASTPDDMTAEEIAYLIEQSVGKNAASRSVAPIAVPQHRNVFYGSDGRAVYVPTAAPPAPPPEKVTATEGNRRRGLSSRRGRAIGGLLGTARKYMGVPYVWGGEDPSGFDCSGYLQHVYARHGIALPRTADLQFNVGKKVERGKEQPGDMVFFETYCPGPSHCGIYIGKGYFIHASSSRGVTIANLGEDFFAARYLGAKRVIGAKKR